MTDTTTISRGQALALVSVTMASLWCVPMARCGALLTDDFESFDTSTWYVPTWYNDGDGTYFGRTQVRVEQSGWTPAVTGGAVRLTVDTYCDDSGSAFRGSEIRTYATYLPRQHETITATVRFRIPVPMPKGIVVAGFFYEAFNAGGRHGDATGMPDRDEIDAYEVLTKTPAGFLTNVFEDDPFSVPGDKVFVPSVYVDWSEWHTVETRWTLGGIDWLFDGVLVRSETLADIDIPDQAMEFRLNAWVPESTWPEAYDESLRPTGNEEENEQWYFEVDSVKITSLSTTIRTTEDGGSMALLIEFSSLPTNPYRMHYTDDLRLPAENWQVGQSDIIPTGTISQWIDSGPPETVSSPGEAQRRFYRPVETGNP